MYLTLTPLPKQEMTNNVEGDVQKLDQQPDNPEDLAKYIQELLTNVKKQYEDMTTRVITAIDDIATRVENLEKNINQLLDNVKTE